MNATTRTTIDLASALGRRGMTAFAVHATTPDGRTWEIQATSPGCFRLFELDPEGEREPQEHDAVEANEWDIGELMDYLDAIGKPRPDRNNSSKTT